MSEHGEGALMEERSTGTYESCDLIPSILAHDFIDNTKSDRGALLLSSVIHTNGLFLR